MSSNFLLKSAYEIAREERIKRNNAILAQLEIESLEEKPSTTTTTKKGKSINHDHHNQNLSTHIQHSKQT